MTPEFSRLVDSRHLGIRPLRIEASDVERGALAKRFALAAIERLTAEVALARHEDAVVASGRFEAAVVQTCAVSGEPLAVTLADEIRLRFVPAAGPPAGEEEVELSPDDCDVIKYRGHSFDLGEAVAQSLALAIDPYAVGADAERVRAEAGLLEKPGSGPFAALAALKTT